MNICGRVCRVHLMLEKMTIFWIGYVINIMLKFFYFSIVLHATSLPAFYFWKAVNVWIFHWNFVISHYLAELWYWCSSDEKKCHMGLNFRLFRGEEWSGLCKLSKTFRFFIYAFWNFDLQNVKMSTSSAI